MIERMDELDGDPDLEDGGDTERTGDEGEPDFTRRKSRKGAGCPIADPDYCTASDDRGGSGPNAHFAGMVLHKQVEFDADCEFWHQPVHLSAGAS
ncbi:hypothetical protein [Sphingomicrobium flavum]|uniref:hypothetical protein n=1 Tax=Sphingomicrobium flavum TaxID=1229164 RepID=UPI0021ADD1A6|nr:hypothetical protein [Sphingomicrobium flavum]